MSRLFLWGKRRASEYIWHFRQAEGVDLSFVKDWADLNHTNLVTPHINQLDIGWTENGEWCNYTVRVARPGTHRIKCLYSYQTNSVSFDLNGKPAATCRLPVATTGYHQWNFGEIGTITFPDPGLQLLTFHYGKGNNFAYFEFEPVASGLPNGPSNNNLNKGQFQKPQYLRICISQGFTESYLT